MTTSEIKTTRPSKSMKLEVPTELHRQLRFLALTRETTLSALVVDLLRQAIDPRLRFIPFQGGQSIPLTEHDPDVGKPIGPGHAPKGRD